MPRSKSPLAARPRRRGRETEIIPKYAEQGYNDQPIQDAPMGGANPVDREVSRLKDTPSAARLDKAFPDPPPLPPGADGKSIQLRTGLGVYQREYVLRLLHRMLLRGFGIDQAAQMLQVSVSTATIMRRELMARMRQEVARFDTQQHIGEALAFYREVRANAMMMASVNATPTNQRSAALGVAMEAQRDMVRFLDAMGVYETKPYKGNIVADDAAAQAAVLGKMAEALLIDGDSGDLVGADIDEFPEDPEAPVNLLGL